jgi:predicted MPP superfamily phosphohydrolase
VLAGHSHGGQIRLPLVGSRSTGSDYIDRHLRGRFVEHGQTLIVSSGIGTSILPLRIGVPPEIVEVTLGPARGYSVGRKSGTDR